MQQYGLEFRARYSSFAKSCLRTYERQTGSVANLAGIQMHGDLTIIDRPPRMLSARVSLLVFLV